MTDDDQVEMHFGVPIGSGVMRFVRRTVANPPPEGTICMVSWGTFTHATRQTGAMYKEGVWCGTGGKPLKDQPTHWTDLADRKHG